ncbi:MAG: tetratricopeptide repeat protein [Nitrospinaceae bacterium]|nr:tetratricopeptide repeat protein [Nitrospinaceae bacterium]NIR55770.1 tetratricopeptide repeat protein [Nitrospinaceae bacterium]NIS86218.1 tetratricopeptide repeat protein [Nitrospinaceae bacterium]NIT83053.1 tetratricopeptide repeat protein [Nitrospinaceae bacterium]NIU45263.1 tetratricopeptide repeat protein [Nitrospinaceae bacterium]
MKSLIGILLFSVLVPAAPVIDSAHDKPFEHGIQLSKQGKFAEAIPYFEKALRLYPRSANVLWNLGIASAKTGQHGKALTYWKQYHQISPEDWRGRAKLIQAYQALSRFKERDAEIDALRAFWKNSDNPELREIPLFCREQFKVNGREVLAYQFFNPSGEWMQFYRFMVLDAEGKQDFYISLGSYPRTNEISRQLGDTPDDERLYHFDGYYRGGMHRTFGFLNSKTTPTYDAIRPTVLKILKGEIREISSSKFK